MTPSPFPASRLGAGREAVFLEILCSDARSISTTSSGTHNFWDPQTLYVPPVPGDLNLDGLVHQSDVPLWENGFCEGPDAGIGDGDGDAYW